MGRVGGALIRVRMNNHTPAGVAPKRPALTTRSPAHARPAPGVGLSTNGVDSGPSPTRYNPTPRLLSTQTSALEREQNSFRILLQSATQLLATAHLKTICSPWMHSSSHSLWTATRWRPHLSTGVHRGCGQVRLGALVRGGLACHVPPEHAEMRPAKTPGKSVGGSP